MTAPNLPAILQRFFTDRLVLQLRASPHTVAGYRDTFRLLLRFAETRQGSAPSDLNLEALDASFLCRFLDYLEDERGNSARSRNTRLAALRSFFHYVAFVEPSHALQCQRVLAIPTKRYERRLVEFLSPEEVQALLGAPDQRTLLGRRDWALLQVAVQTGLRVSEIRSLKQRDVELGRGPHVRCLGKGRKMRCTPLRPEVARLLSGWLAEHNEDPDAPVFPSSRTGHLSADAVQRLVARHSAAAAKTCSSLVGRRITPHTLRHTAAMNLLRSGVDLTVIALWLGHESTDTTQIYLHADIQLKQRALARSTDSGIPPATFKASDSLIAFLESS
jgi:site-specific recombinase XerD